MLSEFLKAHSKLFFLGIGGVSMSSLALTMQAMGFEVCGSDISESENTNLLSLSGIDVKIGHNAENLSSDIDLLIYTAAIPADNPELAAAVLMGIPVITRARLLGELLSCYEYSAAVSGTHGKTTTSGMLYSILDTARVNPGLSLGGYLAGRKMPAPKKIPEGYFVAEACEYHDSFLELSPKIGIILNAEKEHTDYFKSKEQLFASFTAFVKKLPKKGSLIISSDMPGGLFLAETAKCPVYTFGEKRRGNPKNHFFAENISGSAAYEFDLYNGESFIGRVILKVLGLHNIKNALAAAAAAYALGISYKEITLGLSNFLGISRRLEYKGAQGAALVYDDYAHHPTEITASIEALRGLKPQRLVVAFQPHTYSRTKALFENFAKSLCLADLVILLPVYAAREICENESISEKLADRINELGGNAKFFSNFYETHYFLKNELRLGDIFCTMGAGDIFLASNWAFKDLK